MCVLHAWFMRSVEKGSVEKEKQRRRQLQRGTLLIFLLRPEIREVGQEGSPSPGERLLGGSLISLVPPAPTNPRYPEIPAPPWSVPCGSQGQPLAPSNEAPGPLACRLSGMCSFHLLLDTSLCACWSPAHRTVHAHTYQSPKPLICTSLNRHRPNPFQSNQSECPVVCQVMQAAVFVDNNLEVIVGAIFLAFNNMIITYCFSHVSKALNC